MADTPFHYELITPRGQASAGDALYVELPGEDGRLGVLAGHQPAIVGLAAGTLLLRHTPDRTTPWTIGRGVAAITPGGISILTRDAEV